MAGVRDWFRLEPALAARTYRDPLAIAGLVVDLLPMLAVVFLGWGAVALVMLYWLENLIIGAVTIARMIAAGLMAGRIGSAVFLSAFFTVHFGMFCFVHGIFLQVLSGLASGANDIAFPSPTGLVEFALGTGPMMVWIVAAIILFNAALFLHDYIARGEVRDADLNEEMSAPYGRIVVLHVAIFAGFGALVALGEPLLGVLALIVLRTLWGALIAMRRRARLDLQAES